MSPEAAFGSFLSTYLTSAFLSGHGFGERCGSVASGPPVLLSTSCSQVLALGWCAPCHTHVLPCHRCAALIGRTQGWCSCCHSCARRGFCRPWRLSWHTCISRHPTQVGRPIVNTGPHLSPPQALMAETSRLVCALDLRRAKRASVYTSVP